jgi:hypothetical protein
MVVIQVTERIMFMVDDPWESRTAITPYPGAIMQKIKVGIIALAASAIILAPAGSGAATTQSALGPTTATAPCLVLCFDLYEDGLRVGHDADAMTAVKFCWGGIPPLPIETLPTSQKIECYAYQGHQRWIIRSR